LDSHRLNRVIFFIDILITILLTITCHYSKYRDIVMARKEAISTFKTIMRQNRINDSLYEGPNFILKDNDKYVFQWICLVPRSNQSIKEISVPLDPGQETTVSTLGSRKRTGFLCGTLDFPLSEAALISLFEIPYRDYSWRARNLRMTQLDSAQLTDIANFVEIKYALKEYFNCFGRYPVDLEQLQRFEAGYSYIQGLDSLYIHDRYGHKYGYENIGMYVILGTDGSDSKWNFNQAIIDTVFRDTNDHIYLSDDDIILTFRPLIDRYGFGYYIEHSYGPPLKSKWDDAFNSIDTVGLSPK
jgi:hypothetical protein